MKKQWWRSGGYIAGSPTFFLGHDAKRLRLARGLLSVQFGFGFSFVSFRISWLLFVLLIFSYRWQCIFLCAREMFQVLQRVNDEWAHCSFVWCGRESNVFLFDTRERVMYLDSLCTNFIMEAGNGLITGQLRRIKIFHFILCSFYWRRFQHYVTMLPRLIYTRPIQMFFSWKKIIYREFKGYLVYTKIYFR